MASMLLRTRKGYDWNQIAWGKPDSPRRPLCAVCHGALPDVPVMIWKDDGSAAAFCDACADDFFADAILQG